MYCAYITRIKNLHKHPNADRLQIGECFGNAVIVSMEYEDNQLGIYFPSDGRLSVEFAEANNLLRKKDENGKNIGGYMDPDKRNVTAIKLRGEKSDGLFLPLESLNRFCDITALSEGDRIDVYNGHLICEKYIPRSNRKRTSSKDGNKTRKKKPYVAPLFMEHVDTEQLAYNLGDFKAEDEVEITLKMHGISGRTAYLPVCKKYKKSLLDRILKRDGKPIYKWDYISGTRRTVLEDYDGGFYGNNHFREQHSKIFENKLWKGETVYYEIVGFTDNGTPIMSSCNNKKLNDKAFVKQYGEETVFSYGCVPYIDKTPADYINGNGELQLADALPQSDIYVYRMTMTNEDGNVVEYTPDFMRYRCEQMGIKCVPVMWKGIIPPDKWVEECYDCEGEYGEFTRTREKNPGDWIKTVAEQYYDGPDPIGKTHVREGIVARIINRPKFTAYKDKNWSFKALEGIVKVEAEVPDMEEVESLIEENSNYEK